MQRLSPDSIPDLSERPESFGYKKPGQRGATVLLAYLALTLVMTYPLTTQFASAIPGDSFDGWQNYWNLWWVKLALVDKITSPWFTDLLYHPTGVSLLFHTLNVFNGITFLPVQLAFGLLPAYNAVVLFSFVLGGLGTYLLARYVLGQESSHLAAFLAGMIFTFSPYHFAHLLGHMQLIALQWLPFFALYLLRAIYSATHSSVRRARREAALAVLFLMLVALCDWYYVFYCLILTAIVVLWAAIRDMRSQRKWQGLVASAAIWLAAGLILSPLLAPMVREARQTDYMVPDASQSRTLSADLLAFVTPQAFHPVWGDWARDQGSRFTATVSEYSVFAGYSVLTLAAIGLVARWRRLGMKSLWFAVALIFFLLALGPVLHVGGQTTLLPGGREIPLPYAWIARLPFLDIMRSVSRLDVIVMLALGVLAAAGLNAVLRVRTGGRVVAAAALGLVLFEFLPAPYPVSPPDTPVWYTALGQDSTPGAVLNLPANWDRPGYLLYQTVHGKPLTAAYISRDDPRTLIEAAPVLQHFRHLGPDILELDLAAQGQQVLADLGVRWVVLDRYKMPGGVEREYTEATAATIFGGQQPAFEDERITVHEVGTQTAESPYVVLGEGWGPFDPQARTRSFGGNATVDIIAARPGVVTLEVTPVSGNGYTQEIAVQPGINTVTLTGEPETVLKLRVY